MIYQNDQGWYSFKEIQGKMIKETYPSLAGCLDHVQLQTRHSAI